MAEVQRADPRAQRIALMVVLAGFVAAALLIWGLNAGGPAIAAWLKADPARMHARAQGLLFTLAVIMAGPPILAGAYLLRFGTRVVRGDRFPPPDARLIQDMLVLTGDAARNRGRIAQVAGTVLILAGCVMAGLLVRLAFGIGPAAPLG